MRYMTQPWGHEESLFVLYKKDMRPPVKCVKIE